MGNNKIRIKLFVLAGVFGVSVSAVLVRFSSAPSMVLVLYRIGFAALFMLLPGLHSLIRERKEQRLSDLICCLVSGFFLALHFFAYFTAVKLTSIASAVVLVDAEVFFVAFAQYVFYREKLSLPCMAGIAITFAGSVMIALGDMKGGGGSLTGDLYAAAGALFMGIYTILGRRCRSRMSTNSYTFLVYTACALTSFCMLLSAGIPITGYGMTDLLCALCMTVFCTLLGHSIFSWALKYISAAFISTAKLLEPVFASILGILIFSELPKAAVLLGGLVVIAGIRITGRNIS